MDAYEDTKAFQLFQEVLKRGGVIARLVGGGFDSVGLHAAWRSTGQPEHHRGGLRAGFGFLPGVAIDQHFFKRQRLQDMTALMKVYPQLLGIGIDEGTALLVRGEVMEVLGVSRVAVYDRTRPVQKGQPDYQTLTPGGRYNLRTRQVLPK